MKLSMKIGSAKHLGDGHKPTAWRSQGRGFVFDRLNDRFSKETIRYVTATEVALIRELMPRGRLLDLGCGTGRVLTQLGCREEYDAIGLDASLDMLEVVQPKARTLGCESLLVNGMAAEGLPFKPSCFDGMYSFGVLSHYVDLVPKLSMLAPYLKPGAPLLFDYAHHDPVRDQFSNSVSGGLGSMTLEALATTLSEIGLVLDRAMPQRFGSSADITASWFDPTTITAKAFSEMHTVTQRYFEMLLADPECAQKALHLDILLRRLMSYRDRPPYRPAASQLFIVRPDDALGRAAVERNETSRQSLGNLGDSLVAALRLPALANSEGNVAYSRYLCMLAPFLRNLCDGRDVVREAMAMDYAAHFLEVSGYIKRMRDRDRRRALNVRLFRAYRRGTRRWYFYGARLATVNPFSLKS